MLEHSRSTAVIFQRITQGGNEDKDNVTWSSRDRLCIEAGS